MMPEIKICGIQSEEEIQCINGYPVTYMGLIFAKSKRQVTLEKATYLRAMVRSGIQVVGVFMDQDTRFITEVIERCHLDIVQLHGSEEDDMIRKLPVPVWKSKAIKDGGSLLELDQYPSAQGLLLDTYHKGATGGTGKQFNWDLVKDLKIRQKLILAGGLNPDNVLQAINTVHPDVLDLNSGLETDLRKDPMKIKRLFELFEDM